MFKGIDIAPEGDRERVLPEHERIMDVCFL
jgi:hypothetical protein